MCLVCGERRRFSGRVDYIVWSQRDDGTPATNGVAGIAHSAGDSIPCPVCVPSLYGPIVKLEIKRS